MLKSRTEYTPGQMIRFEAAALYHSAATLREIMLQNQPKLDFLDVPATAGMNSIRRSPRGEPNSINRNQEHYNGLIRALEKAREEIEERPISEDSQRGWLLLNQCCYHSMMILGMMEQSARAAARPAQRPRTSRPLKTAKAPEEWNPPQPTGKARLFPKLDFPPS